MRVLDPGHRYALASVDGDAKQEACFVKREGENYPGNIGSHAGPIGQEYLRILIDRFVYANTQKPCAETEAAIALMRSALLLLEVRAARLRDDHIVVTHLKSIETLHACTVCGHIQCARHA